MRTSRAFLAWSPILPLPPRASAPARNAAAAGPRAFSFFSAAARRPDSFGAADWEASPPPLTRPRRRAHRTTPLWAAGFRTSARHPEAQLPPSSPGRDDDEPDEMFAKKFSIGDIPVGKMTFKFSRSSKPGGQNVNKVSTKVDMRFIVDEAAWLPKWVRKRLKQQISRRINNAGEFIITSEKTRTQYENLKDCVEQLHAIICGVSYVAPGPTEADMRRQEELKKRAKVALRLCKETQQKRSDLKRELRKDF